MGVITGVISWILMIALQFMPLPVDTDVKLNLYAPGENNKSEYSIVVSKTEIPDRYKVVVSGKVSLDSENEEKSSAEALIYETKSGVFLHSIKEDDEETFSASENGMPFELRKQNDSHDKLLLSTDRNYILPRQKTSDKSFNYSLDDTKVEISINDANQIEAIKLAIPGIPDELSNWNSEKK